MTLLRRAPSSLLLLSLAALPAAPPSWRILPIEDAVLRVVVRPNGNVVVAGASGFAFELLSKDGAPLSSAGAAQ